MIEFFAHFGLTVGIIIADVLFCASTTFMWLGKDADISDDLFIILAIANTVGFAITLSFLILG